MIWQHISSDDKLSAGSPSIKLHQVLSFSLKGKFYFNLHLGIMKAIQASLSQDESKTVLNCPLQKCV